MQFSSLVEPIVLIKLLHLNIGIIWTRKFPVCSSLLFVIFLVNETGQNQKSCVVLIVCKLLMIKNSDSCGNTLLKLVIFEP